MKSGGNYRDEKGNFYKIFLFLKNKIKIPNQDTFGNFILYVRNAYFKKR